MDVYEIELRTCHFSAFKALCKRFTSWSLAKQTSQQSSNCTDQRHQRHSQPGFLQIAYQYKILVNRNPWKKLLQRPFSIIIPCCLARPGMGPRGITLKALKGFDWKSIYMKFHWLALVGGQLVCIMLAAASGANFWSHHQVVCCQKYICSHPFLC